MTVAATPSFENSFARELEGLYEPWQATPAPEPRLLVLNEALAAELGLDPSAAAPDGVLLAGNATPAGATPIAQAYAGHQFGGYSPRLGDGRALLLGELRRRPRAPPRPAPQGLGPHAVRARRRRQGRRRADAARVRDQRGDARARHPHHAGLAVVATGEPRRAGHDPAGRGAHPRGGQPSARRDVRVRRRRPATGRSCGGSPTTRSPATTRTRRGSRTRTSRSSRRVVEAQAALIARWMLVGFIHGVMNTDNMTISGETIDYGPCAFMDAYDPATVFSSIDHGGRYAYGNQPHIAQWNLARLAETLLPLLDDDDRRGGRRRHRGAGDVPRPLRRRTGAPACAPSSASATPRPEHDELFTTCSTLLQTQRVDYTSFFRALSAPCAATPPARVLFTEPGAFDAWADALAARWSQPDAADADGRVNPIYIPRNHLVEEALDAATAGDLAPVRAPARRRRHDPFDERPGLEPYAEPAPSSFGPTAPSAAPDGRGARDRRRQSLHDPRDRGRRRRAVGVAGVVRAGRRARLPVGLGPARAALAQPRRAPRTGDRDLRLPRRARRRRRAVPVGRRRGSRRGHRGLLRPLGRPGSAGVHARGRHRRGAAAPVPRAGQASAGCSARAAAASPSPGPDQGTVSGATTSPPRCGRR